MKSQVASRAGYYGGSVNKPQKKMPTEEDEYREPRRERMVGCLFLPNFQ
jgi:hypothetical protein